jgi:hypothetical protein
VPQGAAMIDVTVPTYPHLSAETWIDANNLPGLIDIRSASAFLSSAYITCAAAALPASRKGSAPYFAAVWRSMPCARRVRDGRARERIIALCERHGRALRYTEVASRCLGYLGAHQFRNGVGRNGVRLFAPPPPGLHERAAHHTSALCVGRCRDPLQRDRASRLGLSAPRSSP